MEFAINGGSWPVVEDLSFRIEPGRTLGLVGESGSGKTVSALAIMGLLPAVARVTDGSVRFEGRNLLDLTPKELRSVRGDQIAMIFQDPMTCLNPAFTVGNQIAEQVRRPPGRHPQGGQRGSPSRCWTGWRSPAPPPGSATIPTSSPAACASGS